MPLAPLLVVVLAMSASQSALGEPFSLRIGESIRVDDLALRFVEVAQDSRCPVDAQCIVAGEAEVVIRANSGSQGEALVFRIPPAGSDTRRLDRYTLAVTALEPQTTTTRRIEPADYVATLVVTAASP